jgi:hypothetical protein
MNNPTLIKFTVDLYEPGAVISPTMVQWIEKWEAFHTRRIIFPVLPTNLLIHSDGEEFRASRDFCHIRLTSMDNQYFGVVDGVLDDMLTDTRLDFYLGNELSRIAQTALLKAPPYREGRTFAAWIELWECGPDTGEGKYSSEVLLQQVVDMIENKTPG